LIQLVFEHDEHSLAALTPKPLEHLVQIAEFKEQLMQLERSHRTQPLLETPNPFPQAVQTFRLAEHSRQYGEEQVTQMPFSTPYPKEQKVHFVKSSEQVRQLTSEQIEQVELGVTPKPILQEVQIVMLA